MTTAAYAAIYVIWGSTYLAISLAVDSIPPLLMMGLRCSAAGVLLLVWAALRGERAEARHWGHAVIAGGLMFAVSYGALAWAEQRIASGIAALLFATTPFWLAALEWSGGSRPSPRTVVGLIVGLAGVAVLVGGRSSAPLGFGPTAAILFGTIAWSAGSLYARPPRMPRSLALSAGMSLTAGGILLLIVSWGARELTGFNVRHVSAASIGALAYLVVFGSLVAFSAYSWLLRVASPARVATHAYVNPLVAIALGSTLAGEPLTTTVVVAGLVIAAGVAIALAGQSRQLVAQPFRAARRPLAGLKPCATSGRR
jgi:drug/metabolite transporter (DMT)-like permease